MIESLSFVCEMTLLTIPTPIVSMWNMAEKVGGGNRKRSDLTQRLCGLRGLLKNTRGGLVRTPFREGSVLRICQCSEIF